MNFDCLFGKFDELFEIINKSDNNNFTSVKTEVRYKPNTNNRKECPKEVIDLLKEIKDIISCSYGVTNNKNGDETISWDRFKFVDKVNKILNKQKTKLE